ncbi:MAG TPA: class I SAM-dependent methyltransferase [Candidatus Limiplasma sp.]|nr:class I SAM-dependent methyltransferase [Candidatus Limiplasma sp.]
MDLNQNVKGIVNVVNMESIPYGDNTFDVVIANHVIEHVPDEQKALSEVMRVLKPGGFAILSTLVYQNLAQTLENPEYNTDALRLEHYG